MLKNCIMELYNEKNIYNYSNNSCNYCGPRILVLIFKDKL